MSDVNKPSTGDYTFAMAKGGLGAIPIVGSIASELLGLIITPPLEKRRQKWMTDVGTKLKELEENEKVDLTKLSENEQFVDIVLSATSLALKTSEEAKIKAFRNAILNTALGETLDNTKRQIFLSLLDSFTIWHIKILHFIDNPVKWFEEAGQIPSNSLIGSLSRVLNSAFPTLRGQGELITVIWRDLHDCGFHNTTDLMTTMTGDGLLANRTTELGKDFLKFVSSPTS